jgi:hypothetical protein
MKWMIAAYSFTNGLSIRAGGTENPKELLLCRVDLPLIQSHESFFILLREY